MSTVHLCLQLKYLDASDFFVRAVIKSDAVAYLKLMAIFMMSLSPNYVEIRSNIFTLHVTIYNMKSNLSSNLSTNNSALLRNKIKSPLVPKLLLSLQQLWQQPMSNEFETIL